MSDSHCQCTIHLPIKLHRVVPARVLTHPCEIPSRSRWLVGHMWSCRSSVLDLCHPAPTHLRLGHRDSYTGQAEFARPIIQALHTDTDTDTLYVRTCTHARTHARTHTPVQIKPKYWLSHQVLVHHVLEDRHYSVNGDAWPAHAQDAIKLGSNEGDPWLLGSLAKRLRLHCQASNLHTVRTKKTHSTHKHRATAYTEELWTAATMLEPFGSKRTCDTIVRRYTASRSRNITEVQHDAAEAHSCVDTDSDEHT